MKNLIQQLLGFLPLKSKKFVAMLVGVIGTLTASIGWNVDPEILQQCVILVTGYCVGQGIADAGKEAEAIKRAQ